MIKSLVNIDFNQNFISVRFYYLLDVKFYSIVRIYLNKKNQKNKIFLILFNNIKFFIKNSTTVEY